jgi:hypothetical protein
MKHYIITYVNAYYKVKTTGYIEANSPEEAIKNFGIVDEILSIEDLEDVLAGRFK